jgi:hypothetical protein
MYEVLDGLHAGDLVATSGVFLIAAEARISTAAKYWDEAGEEPEAPAPMPVPEPTPIPPAVRAAPPKPALPKPAPEAVVYSCPMHPEVRSPTPGKCPKCGMDLERVPSGVGK